MERSLAGTEAALQAAGAARGGRPAKDTTAGPGLPMAVRDFLNVAGRHGFWASDSEAASAGSIPSPGMGREAGCRTAGGLTRSGDSDKIETEHAGAGAGSGALDRGVQVRQSPRLRVGCLGDSFAGGRWW